MIKVVLELFLKLKPLYEIIRKAFTGKQELGQW
jgi:hypothetical protein